MSKKKSRRGFAAMDPEQLRAASVRGGRSAYEQGAAHEFSVCPANCTVALRGGQHAFEPDNATTAPRAKTHTTDAHRRTQGDPTYFPESGNQRVSYGGMGLAVEGSTPSESERPGLSRVPRPSGQPGGSLAPSPTKKTWTANITGVRRTSRRISRWSPVHRPKRSGKRQSPAKFAVQGKKTEFHNRTTAAGQ